MKKSVLALVLLSYNSHIFPGKNGLAPVSQISRSQAIDILIKFPSPQETLEKLKKENSDTVSSLRCLGGYCHKVFKEQKRKLGTWHEDVDREQVDFAKLIEESLYNVLAVATENRDIDTATKLIKLGANPFFHDHGSISDIFDNLVLNNELKVSPTQWRMFNEACSQLRRSPSF